MITKEQAATEVARFCFQAGVSESQRLCVGYCNILLDLLRSDRIKMTAVEALQALRSQIYDTTPIDWRMEEAWREPEG